MNSTHALQIPVNSSNRNFAIDVIRGVAILGILLMNISGFATPDFFLGWNDIITGKLTPDGFIVKASIVLFDGKMRGLFTLLFGAGLMLFIENKDNSIKTADLYFKRLMWLLLFGVIDGYILLWGGDVLFEYALCGILLFAFRNLSARYMVLISLLIAAFLTYTEGKNFTSGKERSIEYKHTNELLAQGKKLNADQLKFRTEFEEFMGNFMPFSKKAAEELSKDVAEKLKVHHMGYLEIFEAHSAEVYEYQSSALYNAIWESFSTILLGMALFKAGFFAYRFRLSTYRWICFAGIPIGTFMFGLGHYLHIKTVAQMWDMYSWRPFSTVYLEFPGRLITTLGYASALMLLCRVQKLHSFLNLFANTGRMALTNYIMQTIMCSLFFFGFGLDQYGIHSAHYLLIFVICIWIIQITYSNIYLKFFQMGPLEWLWRRLTYGKNRS